jgi:hypothetical protein
MIYLNCSFPCIIHQLLVQFGVTFAMSVTASVTTPTITLSPSQHASIYFPPYFTCFHKFLETVNRILTNSTNLQITAWMQDLLNRFIWIVIGQMQVPCLSDKYHLQLPVGLVIAKNLVHSTIPIRQRCWKVVIVVVFQCQSLVPMGFHWKIACLHMISANSVLIWNVIANSGDSFLMCLVQSRQFTSTWKGWVQQFPFEAIIEHEGEKRKSKTRRNWWQIWDISEKTTDATCIVNGRVCIISTKCNKTSAFMSTKQLRLTNNTKQMVKLEWIFKW